MFFVKLTLVVVVVIIIIIKISIGLLYLPGGECRKDTKYFTGFYWRPEDKY